MRWLEQWLAFGHQTTVNSRTLKAWSYGYEVLGLGVTYSTLMISLQLDGYFRGYCYKIVGFGPPSLRLLRLKRCDLLTICYNY